MFVFGDIFEGRSEIDRATENPKGVVNPDDGAAQVSGLKTVKLTKALKEGDVKKANGKKDESVDDPEYDKQYKSLR